MSGDFREPLEIDEFDLEELAKFDDLEHNTIGLLGIRNSGKTKLAIAIIRKIRHRFEHAILICPTQHSGNKQFGDIFPKAFTHTEPSEEILEKIMQRQQDILENPDSNLTEKQKSVLLVMDDVGSYENLMKSGAMRRLLSNGRHKRITLIILAQQLVQLATQVRNQILYLFAFQELNVDILKRLQKEFFVGFKKTEDFRDLMTEFTVDRGVLVAKKKQGKTASISERVFFYRATEEEIKTDFRAGSELSWLIEEHMTFTQEELRDRWYQKNNQVVGNEPIGSKSKFRKGPSKKSAPGTSKSASNVPLLHQDVYAPSSFHQQQPEGYPNAHSSYHSSPPLPPPSYDNTYHQYR